MKRKTVLVSRNCLVICYLFKYNEFVNCKQNQNTYVRVLDQMKRKLEALEKEDDLDTTLAKLIDQAEEFNIQRFHCSMEFKVEFLLGPVFG